MPLRDDLLNPIPGENPAGADLRYAPVYDKLKEARRQDEDLNQGVWQTERKVADWPQVLKLGQEIIASQSKDLQVAAWLTEALLNREGFPGLGQGLKLCQGLIENFWDYVYPVIEDEDLEFRATPLEWIGTKLEVTARKQPLTKNGLDYFQYKESRAIPTEEDAASSDQKYEARASALKAGKTPPEEFDKGFSETGKAFYKTLDQQLTDCLKDLRELDAACQEKFGVDAPSFSKLRTALDEVQNTNRILLKQKLEIDPDPVEETPAAAEAAGAAAGEESASADVATAGAPRSAASFASLPSFSETEPAERREAVKAVVDAAEYLRRKEPGNPAPFLMLRGLRWGELRMAMAANDPRSLEAPPTEVRQLLKGLFLQQKWAELLEAGERVMALGASRAWLDLQRLVVEACVALGGPHEVVASAIRSELRALLRDLPQLLDTTLLDDSPAANPETRKWLDELLAEPESASAETAPPENPVARPREPGWKRTFVDPYELAQQAVKANQAAKAFDILHAEINRQLSGRGRFYRRIQLIEMAGALGKEALVQPLMDELTALIDSSKLEDWEDPKLMAGALATLTRWNPNIRDYPSEKAKYLARIARLDPARAFAM